MNNVDFRDPDKTYHPMTVAAFSKATPNLAWATYFEDQKHPGVDDAQRLAAGVLQGGERAGQVRSRSRPGRRTCAGSSSPPRRRRCRRSSWTRTSRSTARRSPGTPELQPRWKRCVTATDNALGMALGKIYVAGVLPARGEEARRRAGAEPARSRSNDDIQTLDWMSEATKKAAAAKVATFKPKIGYPDKWRDYSTLDDRPRSLRGRRARGQPVRVAAGPREDRQARRPLRVGHVRRPTVNAYYNPPRTRSSSRPESSSRRSSTRTATTPSTTARSAA